MQALEEKSPPLTGHHISSEFQVCLDMQEEDSKGMFSTVYLDKDLFKLRLHSRRRLTLSVSQPTSSRPLLILRYLLSEPEGVCVCWWFFP